METPSTDIVVMGGSAGAVPALVDVCARLAPDIPAAVLVVLHVPESSTTSLAGILDRAGPLPASDARHGAAITAGRIYVAPPGRHMLVEDSRVVLARGPGKSRQRPAIDPLFRSASIAYGERVIGVVLSGALDDGADGLATVKARGGRALVQEPSSARHKSMPRAAMRATQVDYAVPADDIGPLLGHLAHRRAARSASASEDGREMLPVPRPASPTGFTCPECDDDLWRLRDPRVERYRCHQGHAYASDCPVESLEERTRKALWASYWTFRQQASLWRRLAERSRREGRGADAERLELKSRDAEDRARRIGLSLQGPGEA